jgi:hypothetical protein
MELLVGKRPIFCKWVYKLKQVPFDVETYKARLIMKGDEQSAGINFEETFSPILKWGTLKIIIALTTHSDWEFFHLCVKIVFSNGELHEKIYMI